MRLFWKKKETTQHVVTRSELETMKNKAVSDAGDQVAKQRAFNAELDKLAKKTNLTVADIDRLIAEVRVA